MRLAPVPINTALPAALHLATRNHPLAFAAISGPLDVPERCGRGSDPSAAASALPASKMSDVRARVEPIAAPPICSIVELCHGGHIVVGVARVSGSLEYLAR